MTDGKRYYDAGDNIRGYWDARHAAWAENPNWSTIQEKQDWFNVRFEHLLPPSFSKTGRPRIGKVLDYGCGCGLYAAPLVDRFWTYVGFDTSTAALKIAREYYKQFPSLLKDMYFNEYSGEPGQWQAGMREEYNLVVSITVLQHQPLEYRRAMIENIKTLLKPGGMYIGLEWAGHSEAYDMPPMAEDEWRKAWEPLVIERDNPADHPRWIEDNVWVARKD